MSEKKTAIEIALELLEAASKYRKDDGQGLSVKYTKGDESIELAITQKPGSGGWKKGAQGEETAHTLEEVIAAAKAANFKESDYKAWVQEGKVFCKWPYERKDDPTMAALNMRWDPVVKARWSPLKGAPAPSP